MVKLVACLLLSLAGASALRLPAARGARHAPVRMDATEDRIKEMIESNKCAPPHFSSRPHPRQGRRDKATTPLWMRARARRIMLFMKGNKMFPQCGFSNTAVMILKSIPAAADFETFDVLADQDVREGIKQYSNWPTIPQCYIDGEFIGGCDLLIEMYQSGELQEMVEKAAAE